MLVEPIQTNVFTPPLFFLMNISFHCHLFQVFLLMGRLLLFFPFLPTFFFAVKSITVTLFIELWLL